MYNLIFSNENKIEISIFSENKRRTQLQKISLVCVCMSVCALRKCFLWIDDTNVNKKYITKIVKNNCDIACFFSVILRNFANFCYTVSHNNVCKA